MKITLFLGAGFSAYFGHPVMDRFFGFARECQRLTKEDIELMDALILESRRANSFLESSPTNLEDILSFAVMGERLQGPGLGASRSDRFRVILHKVYTKLSTADSYWELHGKHSIAKLLGADFPSLADSLRIITTNYDLNVECSFHIHGQQLDPGFKISQLPLPPSVPVVSRYYRTGAIQLHKLHGSVNWFPADGSLLVDDSMVLVQSTRRTGPSDSQLPYPCVRNYEGPNIIPVIVPPSFLKPELSPQLHAIWKNAAAALRTSNAVVFVGYSFPPSDTEMMFFLAHALAENAELQAIYLVDPMAKEIAARLRQSNSRIGSHFFRMLNLVPAEWHRVQLSLKEGRWRLAQPGGDRN